MSASWLNLGFASQYAPPPVRTMTPEVMTQNVGLSGANTARYMRTDGADTINRIRVRVGTSSGDISVAVYASTTSSGAPVPGARLATSGAVACPASGDATIVIDDTVVVPNGSWMGLSADNTSATFLSGPSGAAGSSMGSGRLLGSSTATHPLPDPGNALSTGVLGRHFAMIGVLA